jgi:hypothetical protein
MADLVGDLRPRAQRGHPAVSLRLGRRSSLTCFAISFKVTGMRSMEKIAGLRLADLHCSLHARNRTADDP